MSRQDSLVRNGLRAVQDRDFYKIRRFLSKQLPEPRFQRDSVSGDPVYIESEKISRVSISGQYNDFYRITDDPHWCHIIADNPFECLTFDLIHISEVSRCDVEIQFKRGHEHLGSRKLTYHTGTFDDRDTLPININSPEPATEASIRITSCDIDKNIRNRLFDSLSSHKNGRIARPHLGVPSLSREADKQHPPIVIISVDSLRYDRLDRFEPLLETMGDDAIVPDEPRTQGVSTWPAHASLFTGVHPREHGCTSDTIGPQIDPSLTTLGELLERNGYRNSACVSSDNLSPQIGFGRGFHRYQLQDIDWRRRERDIRTVFQTFNDWISRDFRKKIRGAYFLHIFDAHYPYIPPYPTDDQSGYDFRWFDKCIDLASFRDYIKIMTEDVLDVSSPFVRELEQLYDTCVDYVVENLCEFVMTMKNRGLFDPSFIIILGDHGEDFYERNFLFHHSLYEQNIRPGMILKPPAEWSLSIPDSIDYIDILPTIAKRMNATETVDQCTGVPIGERTSNHSRMTERKLDCYNVAVEAEGEKVIFTYTGDKKPQALVEEGPRYIESTDREQNYLQLQSRDELSEIEMKLEGQVQKFVDKQTISKRQQSNQLSQDAINRLEELGYK